MAFPEPSGQRSAAAAASHPDRHPVGGDSGPIWVSERLSRDGRLKGCRRIGRGWPKRRR